MVRRVTLGRDITNRWTRAESDRLSRQLVRDVVDRRRVNSTFGALSSLLTAIMPSVLRLTIFLLVAGVLSACKTEQPCTIKLEQSPELRGLRLGMPVSDIQRRFPGFPTPNADQLGLARVAISNSDSKTAPLYPGEGALNFVNASPWPELNQLKYAELELLDGRLVEINVYYPNDVNWKSADEFAQKTGEALKLNGTWRKVGQDNDFSEMRHLMCGDVLHLLNVSAGLRRSPVLNEYGKYPYVQFQDFQGAVMDVYDRKKARDDRRKREEEQRKETFKP